MPVRTKRALLTATMGAALCLAFTAGLLFLYVWTGRDTGQRNPYVLLFALLMPLLWATPIYIRIRQAVATRHFTRSELMLGTHRPGLGQTVPVRLSLWASKAVRLEGCKLVLRAVETARAGRSTRSAEVACTEVVLPTPERLEKDREHIFEGTVTVPVDGMESVEGRRDTVRWEIEAYALLGKVAVPLDRQELIVQPIRTGEPPAAPPEKSAGERLRLTLQPGALQVGSKAHMEVAVGEELAGAGGAVAVIVAWRTRIAGTSEGEEHTVFAGTAVEAGPGRPARFEFLVPPAGPLSYEGKLFEILWTARATLNSPDGKAIETTELPVIIMPHPA